MLKKSSPLHPRKGKWRRGGRPPDTASGRATAPCRPPRGVTTVSYTHLITLRVQEGKLSAAAFACLTHSGQQLLGEQRVIKPGRRGTLTVDIPAGLDDSVELLGLQLSGVGRLTLLELKTQGMADYQVNPGREAVELGTVTPFTLQHARLLLQDGQLSMITAGRCV